MGVMTGTAGGMVRDILSAEIPLILQKEIYATAALFGSAVYVVIFLAGIPEKICIGISVAVTLGIRLAAIRWGFSLPVFVPRNDKEQ